MYALLSSWCDHCLLGAMAACYKFGYLSVMALVTTQNEREHFMGGALFCGFIWWALNGFADGIGGFVGSVVICVILFGAAFGRFSH